MLGAQESRKSGFPTPHGLESELKLGDPLLPQPMIFGPCCFFQGDLESRSSQILLETPQQN